MLTAVSLFAGVGGFDLAMQRCGIDVVASVEIDKHASKVLAARFPNTHLFSDVSEVTGEQLRAVGFDPSNGIITGGFPCQDLSIAGARRGLAGERSGLFWQIIRLADELRPKWLVLENVPGLLSSNGGRDMGIVIGALEQRGYGVCWRVLDAQHFGVAQRRRRLFIVCCLADHRRPVEILFEPEGGVRHPAPRRKKGQDPASSFEAGIDTNERIAPTLMSRYYKGLSADDAADGAFVFRKTKRAQSTSDDEAWVSDDKTNTLNTFDVGDVRATTAVVGFSHYQNVPNVSGDVSPTLGQESQAIVYAIDSLNSNSMKSSNPDSGCRTETKTRTIDTAALNPSANQGGMAIVMRQREGKDGGGKGPLLSDKSLTIATSNDQTLFISPTLTAYNLDSRSPQSSEQTNIVNAVHSVTSIVRRLTPIECERLQGFPDGWTAGQADGQRYKQMGNAVAVPVVEWIMRRLVK